MAVLAVNGSVQNHYTPTENYQIKMWKKTTNISINYLFVETGPKLEVMGVYILMKERNHIDFERLIRTEDEI